MSSYKLNPKKLLQFLVEIDSAESLTSQAAIAKLSHAAKTINESAEKAIKGMNLFATHTTVSSEFDFTFNNVHNNVSLPVQVESHPVVVQVIYQQGNANKCFLQIKTDLDHFDGVSATHTGFQVLEYMEHGNIDAVSKYHLGTVANGAEPGTNFRNFFAQISRVAKASAKSMFSSKKKGVFTQGINRLANEDVFFKQGLGQPEGSWRICNRFKNIPTDVGFKDLVKAIDTAKKATGQKYYAVTCNFAPKVALALVPTLDIVNNKEERLKRIALPPVGAGPAPDMEPATGAVLFNTFFWNNYGRHNPNISGKIVDFLWDWTGLLQTFVPFSLVVQIQGKLFARICAPPDEYAMMENTGALSVFGEPTRFHGNNFYKASANIKYTEAAPKMTQSDSKFANLSKSAEYCDAGEETKDMSLY